MYILPSPSSISLARSDQKSYIDCGSVVGNDETTGAHIFYVGSVEAANSRGPVMVRSANKEKIDTSHNPDNASAAEDARRTTQSKMPNPSSVKSEEISIINFDTPLFDTSISSALHVHISRAFHQLTLNFSEVQREYSYDAPSSLSLCSSYLECVKLNYFDLGEDGYEYHNASVNEVFNADTFWIFQIFSLESYDCILQQAFSGRSRIAVIMMQSALQINELPTNRRGVDRGISVQVRKSECLLEIVVSSDDMGKILFLFDFSQIIPSYHITTEQVMLLDCLFNGMREVEDFF